ncbi:Isoprenyl transferase [subsurface metagenome]
MSLISSIFSSIRVPTVKELKKNIIPEHVAIIMDGNGRWAARRKLPRYAGHKAGVEALREVVKTCVQLGIKFLTVYSFSIENWQRPKDEVNFLLNLFLESLKEELETFNKNGVRVFLVGDRKLIPHEILEAFENAEKKTTNNNKLFFNIAFNYGSRQEIIEAAKKIYKATTRNDINIEKLDEKTFSDYLFTKGCPDPDFLIRTSGEYRVSNFLLWQIAYCEFYFVKTLWPDFKRKNFLKAIYYYQQRNRRFGRL